MPRYDLTEEEARILFGKQLEVLVAEGAAPDCAEQLAAIFAENEHECLRMERDFAAAEDEEERERRSAPGR